MAIPTEYPVIIYSRGNVKYSSEIWNIGIQKINFIIGSIVTDKI